MLAMACLILPLGISELWRQMVRLTPLHAGSRRSQGKPIGREQPCIILFSRAAPADIPDASPVEIPHETQAQEPTAKRLCLVLEMGSSSAARTSRTLIMALVRLNVEANPSPHCLPTGSPIWRI